ncbi:CUB domain-containing protein 1a [Synchiropus splendidus]|uniref:CUB domain-containing protein 1a n=1 Tax=Synchiropus splendidus TaxID=270530 RepID=UPI00237E23E6|nr:CUB domain-containing protein 1a [Synchiropus splendidus]
MFSSGITATGVLLFSLVFTTRAVQRLTVTPDKDSVLKISQAKGSACKVCFSMGRSRTCSLGDQIKDSVPVTVEFQCSRPQDFYEVEVIRNIECTTQSCKGHIQTDFPASRSFQEFNRKFTWNLRATAPKAIQVSFTKLGVRQVSPLISCPDKHTFTLGAVQRTGNVMIGRYCVGGTTQSAQILSQGRFSLDVPASQELQTHRFDVSVGEEIKSLAKITVTLPPGTSSSELFSPNYPESFPDDDVMEWHFAVSDKQQALVEFQELVQPRCVKKQTAVEYHCRGRGALVLRLTDPPPVQSQGNFSLTLRNCEMDRSQAGFPGLSLKIKVSVSTARSPRVSCNVDLRKSGGFSLHVDKLRPNSGCVMTMDSVLKEKITVPTNGAAQLSFQDCPPEELRVTSSRVIDCAQLKDCLKMPIPLAVPFLATCLPAPLTGASWTLRPPQHGTVELTSPVTPLRQSLPGQTCNDTLFDVSEETGDTVGHFCPHGSIQKIQVHSSVVFSLTTVGGKALKPSSKPVLTVVMKGEISDRYIFTVTPKKNTTVSLATPGWPKGMRSYATVSWLISVPNNMEAHVMFANINQPKCSNRHTNIRVQRIGRREEDYSRREDEEAEDQIRVPASFFLNMSNCMPESREFSVLSRITLHRTKNLMLTTILSVVAALLVVFTAVLVVVCVVIRKKKKQLAHQVSIYNPNGTSFLPGENLSRPTEENEYHIYDSIEDTLVYTHLLKKGAEMGMYGEVETQEPFTRHSDSQKPLVPKDSRDQDMDVGEYQEFPFPNTKAPPLPNRPLSRPMVDNEIYHSSEPEGGERIGPRQEGGD